MHDSILKQLVTLYLLKFAAFAWVVQLLKAQCASDAETRSRNVAWINFSFLIIKENNIVIPWLTKWRRRWVLGLRN